MSSSCWIGFGWINFATYEEKELRVFLNIFTLRSEILEPLWSAEWEHCSHEWSRYWFRSLTFYQILTDDQIPFFHDCHTHVQYLCYHGLHGQDLVLNHDLSGEHHFLVEDHHDLSTPCWNKRFHIKSLNYKWKNLHTIRVITVITNIKQNTPKLLCGTL